MASLVGTEHGETPPALSPDEHQQEGAVEDETSDAFRMYQYKVKQCCKVRPHDWCSCVYSHPGEKAKRRNPLTFTYSGTACPEYRRNGCCKRGDACPFAHGVFECWLHPMRYRTQMCSDGVNCKRRICFFAHTEAELRKPADDPLWLQQQLQMELGTEPSGAPGLAEPVQQGNLDALLNAHLTELQQQQQWQQLQQQEEDAAFSKCIREVIGQFATQGKGLTQSQMMQVLQVLAEQQQQQEQQQPPAARLLSLQHGRSSLPSPSTFSQAQALQQHLGPAKDVTARQLAGRQVDAATSAHMMPHATRALSDPQVQLPDNWAAAPMSPLQQQRHQQVQQQQRQQQQLPNLPKELRALTQQLQALQVAQQASQSNNDTAPAHARSSQSAPRSMGIPIAHPSKKLLDSVQQQQQQQPMLPTPSLSMPPSALQQPCPVSPTPGSTSMKASVPPGKVADLVRQALALQEGSKQQQQQQQQRVGDTGFVLGGRSRLLPEGDPVAAHVYSAPENASSLLSSPVPTVNGSPSLHASSNLGSADAELLEAKAGAQGSTLQQPLPRTGFPRMGLEEHGCSASSQDARVAPLTPPPQATGAPPSPPMLGLQQQQQRQRRRQPLQQRQLLVCPPAVASQPLQVTPPSAVPPLQLQMPHSPADQPLHVLPYFGDAGFVPTLPQYHPTQDRLGFHKQGGKGDQGANLSGGSDICSNERPGRQDSTSVGPAASVSGELGRMVSFEQGSSNSAPRGAPWQAVLPSLDEFCHQSTGSPSVSSVPTVLSLCTGTNHDSNATQLSSLSNVLSPSGYPAGSNSFRTSPAFSHTSSNGTRGFEPITQMGAFHCRNSMPATLAAPVQALNEGPFGLTEGGAGLWETKRPLYKHHLGRPQDLSHHLSLPASRGAGRAHPPHIRRQGASDDGYFLGIPSRPGPDLGLSDEAGQKAQAAVTALLAQVTRRQHHQQQQQQHQQPQVQAQPPAKNPCP